MAEPRRLPVLALFAGLVVVGAVAGPSSPARPTGAPPAGAAGPAVVTVALSSSWYCGGATAVAEGTGGTGAGARRAAGRSPVPGRLLLTNAGPGPVAATVELVSQFGARRPARLTVPAGGTYALSELLPGPPKRGLINWVGAFVTMYGGMASATQEVRAHQGWVAQPCASAAARQWYFAAGSTVRNAREEISLLNPYPADAIADFSFTTEEGREEPLAFEGVVVPARGLAVVNLGTHLRRRQQVAVTVSARTGELVAFETEVVTSPPAGAPPVGAPGAVNPVVPVAGVTLVLGATAASTSQWWPAGGEGPGLTESYAVYNPGPLTARLELDLLPGGRGAGVGSSFPFTLGPWGSTVVTTNGQPWALAGVGYSAHLSSLNGAPVVAQRSIAAAAPAPERGLATLAGESVAGQEWLLPGGFSGSRAPSQVPEGADWLEVLDPGALAATVSLRQPTGGRLSAAVGLAPVQVEPGARAAVQVPPRLWGRALVVSSSRPVLVEQDSASPLARLGVNLAPAVAVTTG